MCDVSHMLTEDFRAFVLEASEQHSAEEEHQNAAAMLAYGIALEGRALLDELQSGLRFDRELAVALVTKWGIIDHFWRWRGAIARGNNVVVANAVLAGALERMLRVLFAINRKYFIGVGHLDEAVATLEKVPAGLSERLAAGFAAPLTERAETIRGLIEETFDLVERDLPEVDVERLRRVFRFERRLYEEPPATLTTLIRGQ